MTEVEITDAGGEKLSMLDFGGFKMSYYGQKAETIRDVYENLPNFEFREDDIFLTSYPKSGNFSYHYVLFIQQIWLSLSFCFYYEFWKRKKNAFMCLHFQTSISLRQTGRS